MKIDFIASHQSLEVGSYRIWIHDAIPVLHDQDVSINIVENISQTRPDATLIFSKNDYGRAPDLRNEKRLIGAINIAADDPVSNLDFVIVGSPEERSSFLPVCKNVFVVNLIERMYQGQALKNHVDDGTLTIGYHGSFSHLMKIGTTGFVSAFLKVREKYPRLKISTLTSDPKLCDRILHSIGLPSDLYKNKKWKFETALKTISEFDVGIVPNITDVMTMVPTMKEWVSSDNGLYETDFCVRYKNKSNAGRSFVFNQLGIPVIADFTPSNMPMFHDEVCGSLASNAAGHQIAIERFLDAGERNKVAKLAYNRFQEIYDVSYDWRQVVAWIHQAEGKNEK